MMQKIAVAFACLACIGDSRRMKVSNERYNLGPLANQTAAFNPSGPGAHSTAGDAIRAPVVSMADRVFGAADAKGGCEIDPKKTAVVFIEYQNEFATEGGKLHDAVKDVMGQTGMLDKSVNVAKVARETGAKVIHAPIMFKEDASDNPNKNLGILAGCAGDKLFTESTWNAEFCDAMKPQEGDLVVQGKKGLDSFPGTNLEELLKSNGIETVALAGFLTNCCVESTMRTAYEKGFNVITMTDCCATTSPEGQKGASEGTFTMFSAPMTSDDFAKKLKCES